jgi:hypothetical protein
MRSRGASLYGDGNHLHHIDDGVLSLCPPYDGGVGIGTSAGVGIARACTEIFVLGPAVGARLCDFGYFNSHGRICFERHLELH